MRNIVVFMITIILILLVLGFLLILDITGDLNCAVLFIISMMFGSLFWAATVYF